MTDYKPLIINNLEILRDNAKIEGGVFQARAYDKVINNLKLLKIPVTSYKNVENIEGAGKNIKLKLKEIIETGNLILPSTDIRNDLLNIYGIGPAKAKSLVEEHKIKSIDELRYKSSKDSKLLTDSQKIGLLCYEDLLERIPREEMLLHEKILNLSKEKGEIVGSFRRNENSSGDIDVMLNMDLKEFKNFTSTLIEKEYIIYILANGPKKMLAICRLNESSKYRRIDLIRNSSEEYPYMKLYFTGTKEFNVEFRQHCLNIGLSLNEHGFTPVVKGLKTEEDIFRHVKIEYVLPENRKAGCLKHL
jgi:DNA polymerase (family 10)